MFYFVCRKRGALGIPTHIVETTTKEEFFEKHAEEFELLASYTNINGAHQHFGYGGRGAAHIVSAQQEGA